MVRLGNVKVGICDQTGNDRGVVLSVASGKDVFLPGTIGGNGYKEESSGIKYICNKQNEPEMITIHAEYRLYRLGGVR